MQKSHGVSMIQIKRSTIEAKVPLTLSDGELAINLKDKKLYCVDKEGNIIEIANHKET